MNKNFIINGAAGVGKDLFVEVVRMWVITNLDNKFQVYNISSVDMVKEAAILLGWDKVKDERGRKFLSDLKILSSDRYNGTFEYMSSKMNQIKDGIIFFHIREPNEIQKMVNMYPNIKTILVDRDTKEHFHNIADMNVKNFNYDYYINNNSSKEEYIKTICSWCSSNINIS